MLMGSGGGDRAEDEYEDDVPVKRRVVVDGTPFLVSPRYRRFRLVARGSYGVVASAEDTERGERVAVKKVHGAFESVQDAKRLLRELRLMRCLTHPNVVALLDIDCPPSWKGWNDVYVVSQFVNGDLEAILRRKRPLSEHQIKYILWGILCGLKYLHSCGVVHRDLKPGNVLVDRQCRVRICDLGLARVIEDEEAGLTKKVMTKSYRAPELLVSATKYTSAIDMWSVGVILHEMLVPGVPLFPKRAFKSQLECILNVIGSPSGKDLEGWGDHVRWYMKFMRHHDPVPMSKRFGKAFHNINPLAIDLLDKLIRFKPQERLTATQALEHPFLAEFHREKLETVVAPEDRARFEHIEPLGEEGKFTKTELKRSVWNEMMKFHPQAPPFPGSKLADTKKSEN